MSSLRDWKYYNHAALPSCAPHEVPDVSVIKNGLIWKIDGHKPLCVRWTTNFDKNEEAEWWYTIIDKPFDISSIKAKRRHEIKKGNAFFEVKKINPNEYSKELYEVQQSAFLAYPKKYRDVVTWADFNAEVKTWSSSNVYGAFFRESGKLCGYSVITKRHSYISFDIQKTIPEYEKYAINAALVYCILCDMADALSDGLYICDGERNVNHETHFQDYLIKYFSFRKAYCDMNIVFSRKISWIISLLFPVRKLMFKFDSLSIFHKINALLKMKEASANHGKKC